MACYAKGRLPGHVQFFILEVLHNGTQSTQLNRFQTATLLAISVCLAGVTISVPQDEAAIGNSFAGYACQDHETHGLHLDVDTAPCLRGQQFNDHRNATAVT